MTLAEFLGLSTMNWIIIGVALVFLIVVLIIKKKQQT